MYKNELKALHKSERFRQRKLFDEDLIDLASNDYLGLAENKKQFRKAVKLVEKYKTFAPKASMLVNGYHPIHSRFEEKMAALNGFEKGLIVGSGFLANLSLIEALVRKGDRLFMDEEYHASGVMASQLLGDRVILFRHNSAEDLEEKLEQYGGRRNIIAVEGVYSMSGEVCNVDIFEVADRERAMLIVDEAHSSGVLGENLLGVFEYYDIQIKPNHIKMGTLGKAYGSYGAYILASSEIISFLENRAKPIIYSTAPSVFDTALALVNIDYISKKAEKFRNLIAERQKLVKSIIGIESPSLIVALKYSGNSDVLYLQKILIKEGFLVGAIRQPTVKQPIIRLIPRVGVSKKSLRKALKILVECVQ
ncbi:MAG: pyridoxal phosphate-dependent aminotransferase family protein [Campylobacterota bacterium]|nr:pyridoxal phosphate-dependent aminotransferase family protein [Campylobacterota bacterium]